MAQRPAVAGDRRSRPPGRQGWRPCRCPPASPQPPAAGLAVRHQGHGLARSRLGPDTDQRRSADLGPLRGGQQVSRGRLMTLIAVGRGLLAGLQVFATTREMSFDPGLGSWMLPASWHSLLCSGRYAVNRSHQPPGRVRRAPSPSSDSTATLGASGRRTGMFVSPSRSRSGCEAPLSVLIYLSRPAPPHAALTRSHPPIRAIWSGHRRGSVVLRTLRAVAASAGLAGYSERRRRGSPQQRQCQRSLLGREGMHAA